MAEPRNAPRRGAKSKRPMIIGIVIAAVIVAALGTWWGVTAGAAAVREKQIRAVVTDYYTAIGASDTAKALSSAMTPVEPADLLTDDALRSSNEQAPLTGVEVLAVTTADPYDRATVSVKYRIGDTEVAEEVPLTHTEQGWRLDNVTSDLTLASAHALTVNGQPVTQTTQKVLPGTYTASSVSKYVDLVGDASVTVLKAGETGAAIAATPELSKEGVDVALKTAQDQFSVCLASKVSNPPDCPWVLSEGDGTMKVNSIKYELKNDPWKKLTFTLDPERLGALGSIKFEVLATAEITSKGITGKVSKAVKGDRNVWVDLDADPPTVVWGE